MPCVPSYLGRSPQAAADGSATSAGKGTRHGPLLPGTDFVLATGAELDKIRAFLGSVGRNNELVLANLVLTDPAAEAGRSTFLAPATRCNGCHNNAGANVAAAFNRNFNTGVERARIADLNSLGIPFDGGFGGQGVPNFNFDADGNGVNDSFGNGTFNTPPLIEAADTGPFFHTNAFATIEDAIVFYTTSAFGNSPSGPAISLSATQIANLGRFLRVLNASFNIQLAIARVNGVIPIIQSQMNHKRELQQGLAALALAEVDDALAVLAAVSSLNANAQNQLATARTGLVTTSTHASHLQRLRGAQDALTALNAAQAALTSTPAALSFSMGSGTLMF